MVRLAGSVVRIAYQITMLHILQPHLGDVCVNDSGKETPLLYCTCAVSYSGSHYCPCSLLLAATTHDGKVHLLLTVEIKVYSRFSSVQNLSDGSQ